MDSLPDTEEEASPALTRPRLGVSACLLGQEVRFDGGHKRHRFITDTLAQYVDLVPVCPEVEMGLGIPRPTLRLVRDPTDGPRAVRGISHQAKGGAGDPESHLNLRANRNQVDVLGQGVGDKPVSLMPSVEAYLLPQ